MGRGAAPAHRHWEPGPAPAARGRRKVSAGWGSLPARQGPGRRCDPGGARLLSRQRFPGRPAASGSQVGPKGTGPRSAAHERASRSGPRRPLTRPVPHLTAVRRSPAAYAGRRSLYPHAPPVRNSTAPLYGLLTTARPARKADRARHHRTTCKEGRDRAIGLRYRRAGPARTWPPVRGAGPPRGAAHGNRRPRRPRPRAGLPAVRPVAAVPRRRRGPRPAHARPDGPAGRLDGLRLRAAVLLPAAEVAARRRLGRGVRTGPGAGPVRGPAGRGARPYLPPEVRAGVGRLSVGHRGVGARPRPLRRLPVGAARLRQHRLALHAARGPGRRAAGDLRRRPQRLAAGRRGRRPVAAAREGKAGAGGAARGGGGRTGRRGVGVRAAGAGAHRRGRPRRHRHRPGQRAKARHGLPRPPDEDPGQPRHGDGETGRRCEGGQGEEARPGDLARERLGSGPVPLPAGVRPHRSGGQVDRRAGSRRRPRRPPGQARLCLQPGHRVGPGERPRRLVHQAAPGAVRRVRALPRAAQQGHHPVPAGAARLLPRRPHRGARGRPRPARRRHLLRGRLRRNRPRHGERGRPRARRTDQQRHLRPHRTAGTAAGHVQTARRRTRPCRRHGGHQRHQRGGGPRRYGHPQDPGVHPRGVAGEPPPA